MEVIIWYLTAFKHQTAVHNNLLMMMCMYMLLLESLSWQKWCHWRLLKSSSSTSCRSTKFAAKKISVCYETSDVSKKWAAISGIFNSVSLVKFLCLAILPSLYLYFGVSSMFWWHKYTYIPNEMHQRVDKIKRFVWIAPDLKIVMWAQPNIMLKACICKKNIFRNDGDRW